MQFLITNGKCSQCGRDFSDAEMNGELEGKPCPADDCPSVNPTVFDVLSLAAGRLENGADVKDVFKWAQEEMAQAVKPLRAGIAWIERTGIADYNPHEYLAMKTAIEYDSGTESAGIDLRGPQGVELVKAGFEVHQILDNLTDYERDSRVAGLTERVTVYGDSEGLITATRYGQDDLGYATADGFKTVANALAWLSGLPD